MGSGRVDFEGLLRVYCLERGLDEGEVERGVVEVLEEYFGEVFGCEVWVSLRPFGVWLVKEGGELSWVGVEEISKGVLKGAIARVRRELREVEEEGKVFRVLRFLRGRIGRLVRGVVRRIEEGGVRVDVDLSVFRDEVVVPVERMVGFCGFSDYLKVDFRWLREKVFWGRERYYMVKRVDVSGRGIDLRLTRVSFRFFGGLLREFGFRGKVKGVRLYRGHRLIEVRTDGRVDRGIIERFSEETGMKVRVVWGRGR